jgi:hypothetical protein
MVGERKTKVYDIEKIHEFIDSLTFPAERSTASYEEIHHKLRQKKLFDEPAPANEETPSQLDQQTRESKDTAPQQSSLPRTSWEPSKDNLPAWETVTYDTIIKETTDHGKNEEASLPEFEPVPEDQTRSPQDDDLFSSYDLLEIEGNPTLSEPIPVPPVPQEAPTSEPRSHAQKNDNRDQKRLRKELKQKVKRERQAYKRQEKEDRRRKRLQERERKEKTAPETRSEKND